jgi:hypothetical protein
MVEKEALKMKWKYCEKCNKDYLDKSFLRKEPVIEDRELKIIDIFTDKEYLSIPCKAKITYGLCPMGHKFEEKEFLSFNS